MYAKGIAQKGKVYAKGMLAVCKGFSSEGKVTFKVYAKLYAKGLAQKGNKTKGGKMSKQRITVAFIVSAEGGKVGKPTVI